jgi:predicted RNase H-like HicB family nuclease
VVTIKLNDFALLWVQRHLTRQGKWGIVGSMEINYTYWQEPSGFFLGYLDVWPEHWTQGKSKAELEVMLKDLYEIYLEDHGTQ